MKVIKDFNLKNNNSYKLNAICKKAYFPEKEEDVIDFYKSKHPFIMLGSGHNIILSKDYYDSNFLIFNGNFSHYSIKCEDGVIEAEAGITMLEISELALEKNLAGVEIFYDIPSSLGGAVIMNAGASGEEIKDVLVKVRYLDLKDMMIKEIRKENMDFEYRNSFFQRNTDKVVLKVWLKLEKGNRKDIENKMHSIKEARWAKQPKDLPNAGSVFKRPPGRFVGPMLDELGLKGFTIGGAQVSEKHSGFIVNTGNATGQNVLDLIDHIKEKVRDRFEVELEVEQRII